MSESNIRNKIYQYEKDIDLYYSKIKKLEQDISELEDLKSKYSSYQREFEMHQSKRKNTLENVKENRVSAKIVSKYYEGMQQLLTGNDFLNAYNGLDNVKTVINSKIQNMLDEIDSYRAKIRSCNDNISYLKSELRKLLET
jgi:chromosome segregation ATPase